MEVPLPVMARALCFWVSITVCRWFKVFQGYIYGSCVPKRLLELDDSTFAIFPEIKMMGFLTQNLNSWLPPPGPHPLESARRTRRQRWRHRFGTGPEAMAPRDPRSAARECPRLGIQRPRIPGVEPEISSEGKKSTHLGMSSITLLLNHIIRSG